MDDALADELSRRLILLEQPEHQGEDMDRVVLLQVVVFCWVLPALLLIWGAM